MTILTVQQELPRILTMTSLLGNCHFGPVFQLQPFSDYIHIHDNEWWLVNGDIDADDEDLSFRIVGDLPKVGSPFNIFASISATDNKLVRRSRTAWMPGKISFRIGLFCYQWPGPVIDSKIITLQGDDAAGWRNNWHPLHRIFVARHPQLTTSISKADSDNCAVENWLHRLNLWENEMKAKLDSSGQTVIK